MRKLWNWIFGNAICKHEFRPKDMQPRNDQGIVKWHCHKCNKMFEAEYGLKILENGKCTGEW